MSNNNTNLIAKSNSLINSKGKYKYTQNELKIICSMISQTKREDKDFEIKEIPLSQVVSNEDFNNHTYLNQLCNDLLSKPFMIPNTKIWVNWFSMLEVKSGVISYRFDPILKPHLLQLKEEFTSYYLSNVMNLNSSYSIHLYELLKQFENIKYRKFIIEDLKNLLSIPNSYQTNNFKNLLEYCKKDIEENTDIKFEYTLEKVSRSFKYINFKIIKNKNNSNDFKTFIKSIRKNYINQSIIVGKIKNESRDISVNGEGKLYYLDDRKEIDNKESQKIWDFLFNNQSLIKPFTKSLFD